MIRIIAVAWLALVAILLTAFIAFFLYNEFGVGAFVLIGILAMTQWSFDYVCGGGG